MLRRRESPLSRPGPEGITMATLNLHELPPLAGPPDRTGYDWITVNSNGGKLPALRRPATPDTTV